ncbi:Crp/Fnr family transcriptional regulator [Leptobacterium sp. I13]|uniref:Crp/Fnr family transcriptional regulator n=1 Tax=Leptobacterium meishanense TaxID=3128904 RepID=UPI0030EC743D
MHEQLIKYHYDLTPSMTKKEEDFLVERAVPMKFKKKETIVREGQICDHVYFINRGIMRSYYLIEGKEQVRRFYFENDYSYSFESFIQQVPSKLIIDALTDCEVFAISHKSIQEFYNFSSVFIDFARKLSQNFYMFSSEKIESFLLQDAKSRYLDLLENSPKIIRSIPNYMIASYLGITPESLSRIKKEIANGNK